MTWAWRPLNAPEVAGTGDNRKVIARDTITPAAQPQQPRQRLESNRDWNTEADRDTLKAAIAKSLKSKGLTQVPDPEPATVSRCDCHVAVKTQTATVQRVYPGGYPAGSRAGLMAAGRDGAADHPKCRSRDLRYPRRNVRH